MTNPLIVVSFAEENNGNPLDVSEWVGANGRAGADYDLAVQNAAVPDVGGLDVTNYVYVGSVKIPSTGATCPVYLTKPGVAIDTGTGQVVSTDSFDPGFVGENGDGIYGGSAVVALANAPVGVQLLAGSALVLPGPPYPDFAAIYIGFVTSSDDPHTPIGWNLIAEFDSIQEPSFVTAADYYSGFTLWAPAALFDYSGYVGQVGHTNGDDSSTLVFVFTSSPGVGVHAADDSNADTPDTPNANTPVDSFPILTASEGGPQWLPNVAPTYLTPTEETFDTGTILLPLALKTAIDQMVTLCDQDSELSDYTGIAIPYVVAEGTDGDPAPYHIVDFGLADAWVTDLSGLIAAGYGLTTNDPALDGALEMANAMGLTDADGWAYLGMFTISGGRQVFFYVTKPDVYMAADATTGRVTPTSHDPNLYSTGTFDYTPLTGGGAASWPSQYHYDDTGQTMIDPGPGKFRLSLDHDSVLAHAEANDQTPVNVAISKTTAVGLIFTFEVISEALGQVSLDFSDQLSGGVTLALGAPIDATCIDHGTWAEYVGLTCLSYVPSPGEDPLYPQFFTTVSIQGGG